MNAQQQTLYDRLMSFQFDESSVELTFAHRLARENGWTLTYADRVIAEYKKFLFLACEAGHVVSPSEHVDQSWHLHLTYTRSYWDELCGKLLARPLHHSPTKGGAAEQAMFIDLYNQTLASYRRLFNQQPPSDIWPAAHQRFGEDLQHVTVNTGRYWIIPKPRWPRWAASLPQPAPMLALGVALPLAAAWSNPLNWTGPEFLPFYIMSVLVAAALAFAIRLSFAHYDLSKVPTDLKPYSKLDPYEAACLIQGPMRAVHAAFAAMIQAGTLVLHEYESKVFGVFSRKDRLICQGTPLAVNAPRLEQALYAAAAVPAANLTPLVAAGRPVAEKVADDLIERDLLARGWPPGAGGILAGLVMASPLLLGVSKIFIGLSRGRPVGFLVVLCLATAVAALIFTIARSRFTPIGKAVMDRLRQEYSSARFDPTNATSLKPAELAMTIGLFGAGMLAVGPLAGVHAMLPKASGGGDCSSSGGGCGGGGGGCGGGGCGGCGGD